MDDNYPDIEDIEFEDENELDACPNCGIEYDDIDIDYLICHRCKYNANKGRFTYSKEKI